MSDDDAPYFEAFMLGTGPFMGAHFGDATPVGEKGAFWWRKYFERFAARMNRRTPPPAKTGELREAVATAIRSRRSNPFNPYILADAALTALQPALDAAREEGRRDERAAVVAMLTGSMSRQSIALANAEFGKAVRAAAIEFLRRERAGASASMNGALEYTELTLAQKAMAWIAAAIERGDHTKGEK